MKTEPALNAKNTATTVPASAAAKTWQDELLWRGVKRSLIAHGALSVVAVLSWVVFPSKPIVLNPSIRVDLVALPDVAKKDLAKFTPSEFEDLDKKLTEAGKKAKESLEEIKKEEPKVPDEPDDTMAMKEEKKTSKEKSKKESLKSAIDRIKALQEIEEDVKKGSQKKLVAKGNLISKGTDLEGEQTESVDNYGDKMRSRLRQHWDLPVWLSRQNMSAQVVVFLDAQGNVIHMVFRKGSGNDQFDDFVKKTIKNSEPFPPPPSEIVRAGVTLGFPL